MAITLKSGRRYEEPDMPSEDEPKPQQKRSSTNETTTIAGRNAATPQPAIPSGEKKNLDSESPKKVKADVPRYIPPHRFIYFPQRLVKPKLDEQFGKFAELMKKLNITIPKKLVVHFTNLVEAQSKMSQ